MKVFVRYFIILAIGTSLYAEGPDRYNVVKPDNTVDPVNLQLFTRDIYNTFQPKKFNKLNTIPNANQIGEQQITLYRSTSTNNARLYTIIDNTTYYISLTDIYGNSHDPVHTVAPTTDTNVVTFGTTTTSNIVTISTSGDIYSNDWTDYYSQSTIVGWSSLTAGRRTIYTKKIGKTVFVCFHLEGASNSTTTSFTVPYTAFNTGYGDFTGALGFAYDNSTTITVATGWKLANNSNVVTCYTNMGGTAGWTATNNKIVEGEFWYQCQ